jgi:hypothetical protein
MELALRREVKEPSQIALTELSDEERKTKSPRERHDHFRVLTMPKKPRVSEAWHPNVASEQAALCRVLAPSENRRRAEPSPSDEIWSGQSAQPTSAFVGKLPFFK